MYAIATVQTTARAFTAYTSENFQYCNQNARALEDTFKGQKAAFWRVRRDAIQHSIVDLNNHSNLEPPSGSMN